MSSHFLHRDGQCPAIHVEFHHIIAGNGCHADARGQHLAADVVGKLAHGVIGALVGGYDHGNLVGNVEVFALAHILDAVHQLASHAFALKVG